MRQWLDDISDAGDADGEENKARGFGKRFPRQNSLAEVNGEFLGDAGVGGRFRGDVFLPAGFGWRFGVGRAAFHGFRFTRRRMMTNLTSFGFD